MPARECVGAMRCPFGAECFAEASRARAREADIVVTNHSLLAFDMLAGRHIVPPHRLLVIDEAHELADRVSSASQAELTPDLVDRAARRARSLVGAEVHERLEEAGDALAVGLAELPAGRLTTGLPAALRRGAARCSTRPPGPRSRAIGDIKADDPDPVRKQQARAVLDELTTTAQRMLGGLRLRRGLGRAATTGRPGAWWWRRCRSPRTLREPALRRPHGRGHLGHAGPGRQLRHRGPLARPAGCPAARPRPAR